MNSIDFIVNSLKKFAENAEYAYVFTYWYNSDFSNHFIEVVPSYFHDHDSFIENEIGFIEDFYKNFPDESISFITSDEINSLSGIEKVFNITSQNKTSYQWVKGYLDHSDSLVTPACSNCDYALAA